MAMTDEELNRRAQRLNKAACLVCRAFMDRNSLTQKQMADALKLTRGQLQNRLSGKSEWHLLEFMLLCDMAGVTADALLGRAKEC